MRKISTILGVMLLLTSTFAFAHGGHGHVMGTVTATAADHIEVKTQDGKIVSIPLAKSTQYSLGKKKAAASDVQIGRRVVVHLGAGGEAVEVKLGPGNVPMSPKPMSPKKTGR
jgi:hypothetical protein